MSRKVIYPQIVLSVTGMLLGLLAIVLSLTGCNCILPTPPIKVSVPAYTNYEAVMAMEIALVSTDTQGTDTTPNNKLKEGDKCPNCKNGKILRDGVPTDDCWQCLGDGICNVNDPVLKQPGEYVITIFDTIVDEIKNFKIPGEKEAPAPVVPDEVSIPEEDFYPPVPKQYEERLGYVITYSGNAYTWMESQRAFVTSRGITVTMDSIPGFHPSKYDYIMMGCNSGRCTKVPIVKTTFKVEVQSDQSRSAQRPQDGSGP